MEKSSIGVKFGDCLQELLRVREWSAARLAKSLNIDSSYVRRWARGERTPALHSEFVPKLAAALAEGLDKSFRQPTKRALEAVIRQRGIEPDSFTAVEDALLHLLKACQIESLSMDAEARVSRKRDDTVMARTHVKRFLETTRGSEQASAAKSPFVPITPALTSIPPIPMAIQGKAEVLQAVIALIRSAISETSETTRKEILLTFQSETDLFDGYPQLRKEWQDTIVHALKLGWNVQHVCRLNRDVERSLNLVNQIMDWTNYEGSYRLYYFTKYGLYHPPYEIVLVQGYGAIWGLSGNHAGEIDSALYIRDPDSVEVIGKFAEQLFLYVEPMLNVLTAEEYFEMNPYKDRKSGNQFAIFRDFSFLTVPFEIMERYLQQSIPDDEERLVHLNRIRDSLHSFQRDIKTCQIRHIYPMEALEYLVRTGQYANNFYYRPTIPDVIVHLKHMLHLLREYERFEIAFIPGNQENLLNDAQWDIKGDHTILLGVSPKEEHSDFIELFAITEGTIIRAFQEYSDELWSQINPLYREKDDVIGWLEGAVKRLENRE